MSSLNLEDWVLSRVVAAVEKALEDTAVLVQAEARVEVPKDTQALMHSIQAEKVADLTYKVTANTNYAYFVHEGHVNKAGKFVPGTPYLTKPIATQKQLLLQRIKDNINEVI